MPVTPHERRAVHFSVIAYQSLVQIYPAEFRQAYGGLMVQAFRDSCLRADRAGGPAGLLSLWARTLLDVFLSVIEQYANRGAIMTETKWFKLSGWFLAASGFLFLAGWAAASRPVYRAANSASLPIDRYLNIADTPLVSLGLLLMAVGILGLRAHFGPRAGRLGQIGLTLSLIGTAAALAGGIGISIKDVSPWWQLFMLGVTAIFIGLGIFGISCIRRKVLPRWNSLPLLVSLPWPLLILANLGINGVNGTPYETPPGIIAALLAIAFTGLALIGYLLAVDAQRSQTALPDLLQY